MVRGDVRAPREAAAPRGDQRTFRFAERSGGPKVPEPRCKRSSECEKAGLATPYQGETMFTSIIAPSRSVTHQPVSRDQPRCGRGCEEPSAGVVRDHGEHRATKSDAPQVG